MATLSITHSRTLSENIETRVEMSNDDPLEMVVHPPAPRNPRGSIWAPTRFKPATTTPDSTDNER